MKRFYINQKLGSPNLILTDSEHNHLANVLRLKIGDEILAVCGDEFDYIYKITTITKKESILKYIQKQKNISNPKFYLTVFLALIKFENLALVVQKLNEIGVAEVTIFNSANCNIPPKSVNISKLEIIAQQSCKQCERSIPISIRGVLSFQQMTKEIASFQKVIFADESEQSKKMKELHLNETTSSCCLVIGCEGGFLESEREILRRNTDAITLGSRILRAETAAIAAASIILSQTGEL